MLELFWWVYENAPQRRDSKLVLLELALIADEQGVAEVRLCTLAQKCRIPTTVACWYVVKQVQEQGAINILDVTDSVPGIVDSIKIQITRSTAYSEEYKAQQKPRVEREQNVMMRPKRFRKLKKQLAKAAASVVATPASVMHQPEPVRLVAEQCKQPPKINKAMLAELRRLKKGA